MAKGFHRHRKEHSINARKGKILSREEKQFPELRRDLGMKRGDYLTRDRNGVWLVQTRGQPHKYITKKRGVSYLKTTR